MRKRFWIPLVLLAFVAGIYYGTYRFLKALAELNDCEIDDVVNWMKRLKHRQTKIEDWQRRMR